MKKNTTILFMFSLMMLYSSSAFSSTNIVCNTCDEADFYGKMYSKAENSVTSWGYYDDIVVANLQTGKATAWRVSSTYYMNGEDDPEVRVSSYKIAIPTDVAKAVDDAYKSDFMALTKSEIIVPYTLFDSAFDVVRIPTNQEALSDWMFAEHQLRATAESLAAQIGGIFNSSFEGSTFNFVFADGSRLSMKIQKAGQSTGPLLYVLKSGKDQYGNPIPEPQTSIVGLVYGFDDSGHMEAFLEQLGRYYNIAYSSFNGGGGRLYYIKIDRE